MNKNIIETITQRLSLYTPKKLQIDLPKAAVLIPIIDKPDPSLLLTLRSAHLRDHPSQVAFPGGKKDLIDENLYQTALRESREEIGLKSQDVQFLGGLSQVISIAKIKVSPFVVKIPDNLNLTPQTEELSHIFEIPLSFFAQDNRSWTDDLSFGNYKLFVPSYEYMGYRLWGLSAMMMVEFLQVALQQNISTTDYPKNKPLKAMHRKLYLSL